MQAFSLNCAYEFFQVCEQCPNVKYEREGYFITVDIEKGMQDGQVSPSFFLLPFFFFLIFIFPSKKFIITVLYDGVPALSPLSWRLYGMKRNFCFF